MSDTKVKIIDIQVRYKDAVDGIAKYRTAIAEAQKIQKDLKKDLKDGKITQQEYDQSMASSTVYIRQNNEAMRTLQNQVNNQIKAQQEQEGSLKQLRAELSNATAAFDAMSRAERESASGMELRSHINEITKELKGAEESTLRFYRNVGNYQEATSGLETVKVKIQDVGKTLLAAAGVGSALDFGKDVVKVTTEYQDGMARIQAVTNATKEDMKMMSDEVRKQGRDTIYSTKEAADAMEVLARGGFTAEEATAALGKTLQSAQANTIDLETAADLMIRTMRGFDMPISEEEMEHANDVLAKTAASSATNVVELGEALKNAAPFGHALKQPIEEVNAALGVLADVGIRGADAGTALRMVILGLSTSTAKQQKVFKEFGIDISQSSLEADGLTKTLQKLKASGIMEASDSANKLADVFGRRVTPQVMALVNNIDQLDSKLGTLQNAQGTTERMFNQSYSDMSVALFELDSAWEAFKIAIGESNNDALLAPMNGLTEIIKWLEEHLPEVTNFIVSLLASVSFAKLVSQAQASFTTIRNSAVTNAEAASATVKTLQQQEITLRKTVASQTVAIENASGTERKMIEARLLANKRELANTEKALVKVKTAEIQTWEKAAALNSASAWKSAMAACSVAVKGFVTASKTALKGFVFTAVIMLAFEAIQKLFSFIDTSSGSTFGKITSAVTGFIKKGLNMLVNAVSSVVGWFKDFTENSRLMQVALLGLKTNMNILGVVFKTVWTIFKTGLKQIAASFKGLISIVGGVATALEGLFTLNWNNIKRGIGQVGTAVTNFWKDVTSNAKEGTTEIVNSAKTAVKGIQEAGEDLSVSKAFGGTDIERQAIKDRRNMEAATLEITKEIAKEKEKISKKEIENTKKINKAREDGDEKTIKSLEKENELLEKRKKHLSLEETKDQMIYERAMEKNGTPVDKGKKMVITKPAESHSQTVTTEESVSESPEASVSGGTGSTSDAKAEKAAKKKAEAELKAMQEAEQSMLDLMEDTAQKRRMQIEKQYNDEIRRLKVRLATEKSLSEEAKEAIRQAIINKEQKLQQELEKLSEEELKRDVEQKQKLLSSRLSIAKKGSEEELRIKKEQNDQQLILDEQALKEEERVQMNDAQQRLQAAISQYGAESEQAQSAKEHQLEIESAFLERRANLQEAHRQQQLELEQQYQQNLADLRQQAWQNQISEMEIRQTEEELQRMGKTEEDAEIYLNQQEGFQMLNLEIVEQGEMDILAAKQQAAEEYYNSIVAQGQLVGETEESYNSRRLQAYKSMIDSKKALRDAEIKNEKAHLNSSKAITNSLISLTSAIGESDENFARLSKILTLAQIAIDTGKAISAGVAKAIAVGWPACIPAVATTVATVMTNMATAISTVNSANFAEGGKVSGPGSGTSDSIPANLSNGEFVMTAKATKLFEPLLVAMNNVGAGVVPVSVNNAYRDTNLRADDLTDSFTQAAINIRPVVSVEEITETQHRVEIIQSLDNL